MPEGKGEMSIGTKQKTGAKDTCEGPARFKCGRREKGSTMHFGSG